MDHTLLNYYQQELDHIRQLANEFAQKHPKVAARLRLGQQGSEDHEIERLFQSYALLNAKLQHRLHDAVPEISYLLLENLAPHLIAPIPSMSVVQFHSDQTKLMHCKTIPAETQLKSDVETGETCYFTTRYPVELWPIKISSAKLIGQPLRAPVLPLHMKQRKIKSSLVLNLQCKLDTQTFSQLAPDKLRFFIRAEPLQAFRLQALLLGHTQAITLATHQNDFAPIVLDAKYIQQVGFAEDEGMLPYAKKFQHGYRLLNDFFIFPEKFLFFDVIGLKEYIVKKFTQPKKILEIYFYFDKTDIELEKQLNEKYFALGCTPVVNLFSQKATPIQLNDRQIEYPVIPETGLPKYTAEIYSIERVVMRTDENTHIECKSFYEFGCRNNQNDICYQVLRKPAWQADYYDEKSIESYLIFTDGESNLKNIAQGKIDVDLLCTNRELPIQLKSTANLELIAADDLVAKITALMPMTPTQRPILKKSAAWEFIEHLSHRPLLASDSIISLQKIIELYNFSNRKDCQRLSNALLSIDIDYVTKRNPYGCNASNVLWRGLELNLCMDENKLSNFSLFLFGSVLEQFFPLHQSITFFTQLTIKSPSQNVIYQWPQRAGIKSLI